MVVEWSRCDQRRGDRLGVRCLLLVGEFLSLSGVPRTGYGVGAGHRRGVGERVVGTSPGKSKGKGGVETETRVARRQAPWFGS